MPRLGASAADGGRRHEEEAAEEERPPPALPVGEGRRGHDEHAHRQAVGRDHPLQRLLTAAEVLLDVGQGDVHDRGVEVDHEQAEAGRQQGQPLAVREADSHAKTLGRPGMTLREQRTAAALASCGDAVDRRHRARPRPGPGGGPGLVRRGLTELVAPHGRAVRGARRRRAAGDAGSHHPARSAAGAAVRGLCPVRRGQASRRPAGRLLPGGRGRGPPRRRPAGRPAPHLLHRPPRRAGGGVGRPPLPDERGRPVHAGRARPRCAPAPRAWPRARARRRRHRLRPGAVPGPLRLLPRRRSGLRGLGVRGPHRLPARGRARAGAAW